MYVAGFVIPVPENAQEAYREWARKSAEIFREYGCIEIVDAWEEDVPDGRHTDFRKAVAARAHERIVFSWQIWPDKATVDAAEAKMKTDPRMEITGDIPFDRKRLIYGGFEAIHLMGRSRTAIRKD